MAEFKGFKQVSLSTYLATSEENRKDYLWFVREFSGETVVSSAIYFGNRKYADLTGEIEKDVRVDNIINSLGGFVDENGEWVGFLPVVEHELLSNSAVTSVEDALSVLEAAILANADTISGKISREEYEEKIAELEGTIGEVTDSVSAITGELSTVSGKVEGLESAVAEKANATDLETLSGTVENVVSDLENVSSGLESVSEKTDALDEALSALTGEVAKKANASDIYTKNEVYNKEEIDAKIVGAFKFKGEAESISADETTITVNGENIVASSGNTGDVYQINDEEYASNGEKWVKLGFNVDLSEYAKKSYVDSAITQEAAEREALEEELVVTQSALTIEIEAREALGGRVEDLEERATITAQTYSDAEAISSLRLGQIIYVMNSEEVSGITYSSGAYINTQSGLKKLDSTAPSSSTTLEERVEILENTVGSEQFSGNTLTGAVAALQAEHTVTGDDVEE